MVSALNSAQQQELFELFPDLQRGDGYAFDSARQQARGAEAHVLGTLGD
jgi:hypothetical protein